MTVTYTAEVATCRGFGCFLKLLFRWEFCTFHQANWMASCMFSTIGRSIDRAEFVCFYSSSIRFARNRWDVLFHCVFVISRETHIQPIQGHFIPQIYLVQNEKDKIFRFVFSHSLLLRSQLFLSEFVFFLLYFICMNVFY